MKKLNLNYVKKFVSNNIEEFHKSKLNALQRLKLKNVLKKKNPYLFKAKNINTAHDFIKTILDAYISSQEETIFGDFLERLAIFVCQKSFDGRKSGIEGIDLEFEKDGNKYIVAIKSGPNWGNSSQVSKMKSDFEKARKVLRTSGSKINVITINGCCYGQVRDGDKGSYLKVCGQEFWELISGNNKLYILIIEPLGYEAKTHNELFDIEYGRLVTLFTQQFTEEYCVDGLINWTKIIEMNSAKK